MQGKISTLLAFTAPGSNALAQVGGAFFTEWAPNGGASIALGVGLGQANRTYSIGGKALAGSAQDLLDLNGGGLLDVNGRALDFVRIKHILLRAPATNPGAIQIGNAATNAFVGPFSAATGAINVAPGEIFSISNYSAAGWVVTPATADILRVANTNASPGAYDLILVGADA